LIDVEVPAYLWGEAMTFKIKISDLTLGQLNGACIVRINKFLRILEQRTGKVLELNEDNLVGQVIAEAKHTSDPDLIRLYGCIKEEAKKHINSPNFIKYATQFSEAPSRSVSAHLSAATSRRKH